MVVGISLLVLLLVVLFFARKSIRLRLEGLRSAIREARLGDCVDPEVTRAVDQAFNHQRPPF